MVMPFPIIYAPNPIFRQKAKRVEKVDERINAIIQRMLLTLKAEHAVGIAATMVGVMERIVIVQLVNQAEPLICINPNISWRSKETQSFEEASICFPGIEAKVTRAQSIKLDYLNTKGEPETLEASDFLATVIQHEVDYLDGVIFVDYLSKMKKEMLLKKSEKHLKMYPPHVHTASCHH
jgi:peptide deformylase